MSSSKTKDGMEVLPNIPTLSFDDRLEFFRKNVPELALATSFTFNGGRVVPTVPLGVTLKDALDWKKHISPLVFGKSVTPERFPLSLPSKAGRGISWSLSLVFFEKALLGSEQESFIHTLEGGNQWHFGGIEQALAMALVQPKIKVGLIEVLGAVSPEEPSTRVNEKGVTIKIRGQRHLTLRFINGKLMFDSFPHTPFSGFGDRDPILIYREIPS